jgi:hypothetical protein
MSKITAQALLPPISHYVGCRGSTRVFTHLRYRGLSSINLGAVVFVAPAKGLGNLKLSAQVPSESLYNSCDILAFLLLFQFQVKYVWVVDYLL